MSHGDRPTDGTASDGPEDLLSELFQSGRLNALVSWALVGVLGLVFVESLVDFDRLWILFVATTGVIVLVPPVAYRDWRTMLPWEVLVFSLLPILVRGVFGGELGTFAYYLSVAGLALVVTVELHTFTSVRMTHWFAVVFVTMTTMASVAAWAVVRWSADGLLGTQFLTEPGVTQAQANAALMTEFVRVAVAGLVAGVLFDAYFKRRGRAIGRRVLGALRR